MPKRDPRLHSILRGQRFCHASTTTEVTIRTLRPHDLGYDWPIMGFPRRSSVRDWCRISGVLLLVVAAAAQLRAQTPVCSYNVVNTYPHDDDAFTQGLLYDGGELFESTGIYGESSLRRVALVTGTVLQSIDLDPGYFGEGLALWEDRLIQLTYLEHTALLWDASSFAATGSFAYSGQGWGLTHDGRRLIMSDGSSSLRFRDPETFVELGAVSVTDDGSPVIDLNELEWIRGEVFANIWQTRHIIRIDPNTGEVIAKIDLDGLLDPWPSDGAVLNGIAWDDDGERLFVTGKWWPNLFEIELVDCPELRLFYDGFETGGAGNWSTTQP
jgi:glutaminyl-peptide cyclotransferase